MHPEQSILYFIMLVGVGIPTVIFYGWILLFAVLALVSARHARWSRVATFSFLALAPCVAYATYYAWVFLDHQSRAEKIVRAQDFPKPPSPPRTLVVHGPNDDLSARWQKRLVEMGAFDKVYVTLGQSGIRYVNERNPSCKENAGGSQNTFRARTGFLVCATAKVDRVPDDGLHFYVGSTARTPPGPVGKEPISLELRMIDGVRQDIVGSWAILNVEYPVFPPILTMNGFQRSSALEHTSVPYEGELALIFKWLGLKPSDLKPQNLPAPSEIRAEFLKFRDSPNRNDRKAAGFIASAVGAAVLTKEDVEPLIASTVITDDFAGEIGFVQFCRHINRLCDFRERLVAVCKSKRIPAHQKRCDLIPQQCNWCETNSLCQPETTGDETGCTKQASEARDKSLEPLRKTDD